MEDRLEENPLHFAARPTRVDMKKLKSFIWEDLNQNQVTNEKGEHLIKPTHFSHIYHQLPKQMSPLMAKDLTAPLAFVSLLHLANEHNLSLQSNEEKDDITISKPAAP